LPAHTAPPRQGTDRVAKCGPLLKTVRFLLRRSGNQTRPERPQLWSPRGQHCATLSIQWFRENLVCLYPRATSNKISMSPSFRPSAQRELNNAFASTGRCSSGCGQHWPLFKRLRVHQLLSGYRVKHGEIIGKWHLKMSVNWGIPDACRRHPTTRG
jgi:hypothetical protein